MKDEQITKAFELYAQGYTLREIAKKFKVRNNNASFVRYHFRKKYGDNYTEIHNKRGVISIIKEYLDDPNLSEVDKLKIKEWMNSNIKTISNSDYKNKNIPLYTQKRIEELTWRQCFHKEDLRIIFSEAYPFFNYNH